jgi:hypothetical protein
MGDWELNFIICFDLLSMWLSQSYDQSRKFGSLTQVKSRHFFLSMRLFLSDNPGHRFSKLTWVVFYVLFLIDLFSMRFSRFYDLDRGFNWLTRVTLLNPFLIDFFQFHPSTLVWLRIKLHNLFWFAF